MAEKLRFVVTVDDPGGLIRDLGMFRTVRELFEAEGAPATFFVVPAGEDGWRLDQVTEWRDAVRQAEAAGHNCQLHGLHHQGCEFGPFDLPVRILNRRDPEETLREDTARWGHLWRRDLFAEKLTTAIDIFEGALGRRPEVFRSGALSQSPELYQALEDVGIRYVSNRITDPRGWQYIVGNYDNPGDWDPEVPPCPYRLRPGIINLPIISEYAWQLTPEKVEPHLALAVDDLERVYQAGGVFLLVCHVQEVGAAHPLSRVLLQRLLRYAKERYSVEFLTVRDLVAEVESGTIAVQDGQSG